MAPSRPVSPANAGDTCQCPSYKGGWMDVEYLVFSAYLEDGGLYQQGPGGSRMVAVCMSLPGKYTQKFRQRHTFFWVLGP